MHYFLEITELDLLVEPAGDAHPDIIYLDAKQAIAHPRQSHNHTHDCDHPRPRLCDIVCAAYVLIVMAVKAIGWLGYITDGPREESQ